MSENTRPQALVVHESMFGNTARAAAAIADSLERHGVSVQRVEAASASEVIPEDLDLLVIGAPTHAFGLSRPNTRADAVRQGADPQKAGPGVREWLVKLHTSPRCHTLVAAFDTRISKVEWLPAAAGPSINRLARRAGLQPYGRPLKLRVADTKGPLLDGELERAERFGEQLAERCRTLHG